MRVPATIDKYRVADGPMRSYPGEDFGAFFIPGPCGAELKIIASAGDPAEGVDWEHVSVSTKNRCPNWTEMCFVKDLFFDPEETVMQLHPPKSQWINIHPNCLHLWRPKAAAIPLPPRIAV